MYFETKQYELTYVAADQKADLGPQIAVIIHPDHLDELSGRLVIYTESINPDKYFFDKGIHFSMPTLDLFGNQEFGYRECGYCTMDDSGLWLRVELGEGDRIFHCTLTLHVLFHVLSWEFDQKLETSQSQQIFVETSADNHRAAGWGHAVGGYVSRPIIRWLRDYARKNMQRYPNGMEAGAPMPDCVSSSMREAWCFLEPGNQDFAKYCYGIAGKKGSFCLNCFGDACDLSVYPDQLSHYTPKWVSLGCHNLDGAAQQLTLLAGLAKLCELVREGS